MKAVRLILFVLMTWAIYSFFPNIALVYYPFILLASGIVLYLSTVAFRYTKEKRMLKNLSRSGMKDIDKMDGLQFEVYLKALLKELGYKSSVTQGSNDFGADLIMKNKQKKIVIQAKRYGFKKKVGIDAIQQIFTAKTYYGADDCSVMTNSTFTTAAITLANACNVKLYDRYQLSTLINKINPEQTAEKITKNTEPQSRKCPVCSDRLIRRTNKKGEQFMGCSNYPACTHTEPVSKN